MRKLIEKLVFWLIERYDIVTPRESILYFMLHSKSRPVVVGDKMVIPPAVREMLDRAKRGVSRIDNSSAPGTSGEWKRHILLDELMQAFPEATQKDRCLAIELAVRE